MPAESEKVLERKLSRQVLFVGGLCIKLLPYQFAGLPDRLCLFPGGRVCFVEVKTTGQKPRKIQVKVMRQIQNLGFDVRVIDTSEQVKKLIEEYC